MSGYNKFTKENMMSEGIVRLISFKGTASRKEWVIVFLLGALTNILSNGIINVTIVTDTPPTALIAMIILGIACNVAVGWIWLATMVRRLRDVGLTPAWALIGLMSLVFTIMTPTFESVVIILAICFAFASLFLSVILMFKRGIHDERNST